MTAPLILASNTISGEYEVANSLRFDDGSSDNLTRSVSSTGNRRTATFSAWIKLSTQNINQSVFDTASDTSNSIRVSFNNASSQMRIFGNSGGSTQIELIPSQLFRDLSAWYHIVLAIDTTQSTSSNRAKLYVNGSQISSFGTSTYPSQNADLHMNYSGTTQIIGTRINNSNYFDGYMAEVVNIDGSQLDPTSFGEFDEDTGIWKPIDVSGLTFGNNGFYLDFENSGSLGADVSGNGNNFTVNNLTSIDQSIDTCTNNFATLNPLDVNPSSAGDTFSEGNLKLATNNSSNAAGSRSTIAVSSGKWYCEVKYVSNTAWNGVMATDTTITGSMTTGTIAWYQGRTLYVDGSNTANWGTAVSAGDIVGIALDMDNNRVTISQGGQWWGGSSFNQSQPHTFQNLTSGYDTWSFLCRSGSGTSTSEWNFGSPSFSISSGNSDGNGYGNFEYSVPANYYSLCSKNLAEYG